VTERVFLHIGLPKTGTTYLQLALWHNKASLADAGLLLPGRHRRRHLLASLDLRGDPTLVNRAGDVSAPWDDLVREAATWHGDVLISHEFFGAATASQVQRALDSFPDAEMHVVVTAREMVGLTMSRWQEYVRHGGDLPIDEYPPSAPHDPADEWAWGGFDLADILDRWGSVVRHDRIHVLPMATNSPDPTELLRRFLALVGQDATKIEMPARVANESLGLVETELVRRITPHMRDFRSAADRGNWIRGYLAAPGVMPALGEKFRPSETRLAELEARGNRAVATLREGGYDVVGDLSLLEPIDVRDRREPGDVTDAEQLELAVQVIAHLMTRVRQMRRQQYTLSKRREPGRPRVSVSRFVTRWGSRIRKEEAP
jgi:hypothetical protein